MPAFQLAAETETVNTPLIIQSRKLVASKWFEMKITGQTRMHTTCSQKLCSLVWSVAHLESPGSYQRLKIEGKSHVLNIIMETNYYYA